MKRTNETLQKLSIKPYGPKPVAKATMWESHRQGGATQCGVHAIALMPAKPPLSFPTYVCCPPTSVTPFENSAHIGGHFEKQS